MAAHADLSISALQGVLEDYGLGRIARIDEATNGGPEIHRLFETSKGKYLLRVAQAVREYDVKRELELLGFLSKHSFPCPWPLQDRNGRFYREHERRFVSIYRWSPGQSFSVEGLNDAQLESTGRALANLHVIGRAYKKGIDSRHNFDQVSDLYWRLRPRLPSFFSKISRLLDEEFDYLHRHLEQRLPKGVIHGDLFADRLLFRGDRLTSILAFESATRGKFIADLATAVNALCFVGEKYWLARFRSLMLGYESVRALSLAEWDAFPNELRYSSLRLLVTGLQTWLNCSGVSDGKRDFREFLERLRVLRREKDGGMDELLMAMATGYDYRKYQKVKGMDRNLVVVSGSNK
jgi:homoserine kinase type II